MPQNVEQAQREFDTASQQVHNIKQQRQLDRDAALQKEVQLKTAIERATPQVAVSLEGILESVREIHTGEDEVMTSKQKLTEEIELGRKGILDICQDSQAKSDKAAEERRQLFHTLQENSRTMGIAIDRRMHVEKLPTIQDELQQLEQKFRRDSGLTQLETCIHRFFFHFWIYSDELKQNLSQQKQAFKQKVEQLANAQSNPIQKLAVYKEFRNSPVIATHRNSWFRAIGRTATQIQFDNEIDSLQARINAG